MGNRYNRFNFLFPIFFNISSRNSTSCYNADARLIFPSLKHHHLDIFCRLLVCFLLHICNEDWELFYHMIKILTVTGSCHWVLTVSCEVFVLPIVVTDNMAISLTFSSSSSLSLKFSSTNALTFLLMCMSFSL